MVIRLAITKNTFQRYILMLGYSDNISQFNDFIKAIRRLVLEDISKSFKNNTLEDRLSFIFKDIEYPSILLLVNEKSINKISSEYLKEVLENTSLKKYLSEKEVVFTKEQKIIAYKLSIVSQINFENLEARERFLFKIDLEHNKTNKYIKAINYLNSYRNNLDINIKDEIEDNILLSYKIFILTERNLFKKGSSSLSRMKLANFNYMSISENKIKEYIARNILTDEIIYSIPTIEIKYIENTEIKIKLSEFQKIFSDLYLKKFVFLKRNKLMQSISILINGNFKTFSRLLLGEELCKNALIYNYPEYIPLINYFDNYIPIDKSKINILITVNGIENSFSLEDLNNYS